MKKQYYKPELNIEILMKADVLLVSEQTDNRFVDSQDIFKDDFTVDDILQG